MSVLIEGQRLGAYRIVRLLGEGGMGAVYEARQEPLDRRVALKTLHADHARNKEFIARFFNEAKVLSQLEHPSIVQVSDFGHTADGTAYLVMEYLRGQSLGHRLRELTANRKRLPLTTALQVCVQVADVLGVAHEQGIVHRDIKSENLMLVADPVAPGGERVKVLDFGIAKLSKDRGGVKTATHQMMGTPAYMSPEQCRGAGEVDSQTDVYALGCVLYEMLAGQLPFVAEGAGEIIAMHLFQEPPALLRVAPQVPSAIADLVHRMLRKEKAQRPTMKEAAKELANLLSKQTGGGVAHRPLPSVSANEDETKVHRVIGHSSTMGRSIGQLIHKPTRAQTGVVLSAVLVLLLGGVTLVTVGNVGKGSSPTPLTVSPALKGRVTETPKQTAALPDLGTAPPQDSGVSIGESVNPKESEKESPLRSNTSSVVKKPTSHRPATAVSTKKRFGYEE